VEVNSGWGHTVVVLIMSISPIGFRWQGKGFTLSAKGLYGTSRMGYYSGKDENS
jgi:hypothetical protein